MNRRVVSLTWMLFFAAAVSQAATLTFDPENPRIGETVEITVLHSGCIPSLETDVDPPTASSNGKIRLNIVDSCDCVTPPPTPPLKVRIGPLAFGTYDVELYSVLGVEGDPNCNESTLLETDQLVVSRRGQIRGLLTEPRQPSARQPVTAVINSFCPMAWKQPRIEGNVILIEEDPDLPVGPCDFIVDNEVRLPVGPLGAGTYVLRVIPPEVQVLPPDPGVEAESVFTVTPVVSSILTLGNRFEVSAIWETASIGDTVAQPVQLTQDSGYFWFRDPNNVELVVKVLNGCGVNNRFWVFVAGLTNVGVTLTVEDTFTGATRTYTNPVNRPFLPVQDTNAFASCGIS
jgi:hypothetical protein